ncbi:MAG TPA: translation elongation factor Ts [Chitinophagales bacterium]|nr:translation elongation factor Ts [Chitinophagales bacterium]HRK26300.1 translation elongation factor Ts [Chitinophagales bacterium]
MDSSVKITAKEVNELRQITGAGMMDCKKALVEANGDFEAAIEYLRKKGQKVAANRADRSATEGAAIAKTNADCTKGVVLVLGCETDFVAKNQDFVGFAHKVADVALATMPADLYALLSLDLEGVSIADRLTEQIGKIGEKIEISQFAAVEAPGLIPYIHAGNRIGVLVAVNKAVNTAIEEVGKDVAMQVAAMMPIALDESSVPQSVIEKELEIGKEQAIAEGKPAEMAEKIAQGKLKKYFKDSTLLNQQFVKDNNLTVRDYVKSIDKELAVIDFKRAAIAK